MLATKKDDIVSFAVLCSPQSGAGIDEIREHLSVETVQRYSPSAKTKRVVADALASHGFRVFLDWPSPVVSAEGPRRLFEKVFNTSLIRRSMKIRGRRGRTIEFFAPRERALPPDYTVIPGALHVSISMPPMLAESTLPTVTAASTLRVPGDVAMLMGASATHRMMTPTGQAATGRGIKIGVIDTGFYPHPFYKRHGYRLTPAAISVGVNPEEDDEQSGHGTKVVANAFACAPDAEVLGVKFEKSIIDAVNYAVARGVHVLSISLVWNYDNPAQFPDDPLTMRLVVTNVIASGVTVVAAVGNKQGTDIFPALLPEAIAVGGAAITRKTAEPIDPEVWSKSSSFIYDGRAVPDVCGLASEIMLPAPPSQGPSGWQTDVGTSLATPQVAGVVALLLQKHPGLSPALVKQALQATAIDITRGKSGMNHLAGHDVDLATGSGLVNALAAWNTV